MMPGTLTLKGGISLKKAKKPKKDKKKSKKKKKRKSEGNAGSGGVDDDVAVAAAAAGSPTSENKRKLAHDDGVLVRKKRKPSDREATEELGGATSGAMVDKRTAAEKAMDRARAKREDELMRKSAALSYREKVDKFNNYLESLSEHHDVPKVGNAGMG